VGSQNEIHLETRMKQIRAGIRVNSRVPVMMEWTEDGRTHNVQGFTLDISPKGCLAVAPQGFAVGQRLKLVNLTNKNVCDAVLIWRGHEGRTGWELGLELQEPSLDYWDVVF